MFITCIYFILTKGIHLTQLITSLAETQSQHDSSVKASALTNTQA